jgi:hypothetical protein
MSRLTEFPAPADPLQRRHTARAIAADPSHPVLSGLVATAPRLAAVMAFAGLVQMTFNALSR